MVQVDRIVSSADCVAKSARVCGQEVGASMGLQPHVLSNLSGSILVRSAVHAAPSVVRPWMLKWRLMAP